MGLMIKIFIGVAVLSTSGCFHTKETYQGDFHSDSNGDAYASTSHSCPEPGHGPCYLCDK